MAKTVIVGCKLPTGLVLQLRDEADPKIVKAQVTLKGATPVGTPEFPLPNAPGEDGIGLTPVDEDLWLAWEAWASKNNFTPYVKGFIFAASTMRDVRAEGKEKLKELSGFEGLNVPLKEGDRASDPRLAEFKQAGMQIVAN